MKFKYASGIVPGTAAIKQFNEYGTGVGFTEENGVSVLFLADRPDTAELQGYRRELPAEIAAALLVEHFDALYQSSDQHVRDTLRNNINDVLKRVNATFSDDSLSLLFVAVKGTRYLAGHLGGGMVAVTNGSGSILSGSSDMETSPAEGGSKIQPLDKLKIFGGELKDNYGFMLLSDGACRNLVDPFSGDLSPACNTFFQWLSEYDTETVSEALADNIDKYFNLEGHDDIGVVLMVEREEDETEAADPAVEEEPDNTSETETNRRRLPGFSRKHIKYIVAGLLLIIGLSAAYAIAMYKPEAPAQQPEQKQVQEPEKKPVQEETKPQDGAADDNEPVVTFSVVNPEPHAAGEYQSGEDLPAGEYFFWTGDMLEPDSVTINGDTCLSGELYCMTIRVEDGDTLDSQYRFTEAENVNPVATVNGTLISGKYKIGKDIMPGEYMIKPASEDVAGRYYSVNDGEIGNDTEVVQDTAITVPDEGYVVFYNSILIVGQD